MRPSASSAWMRGGDWAFLGVAQWAGPDWRALAAGIVVTAGLRLAALAFDWRVPGRRDAGS